MNCDITIRTNRSQIYASKGVAAYKNVHAVSYETRMSFKPSGADEVIFYAPQFLCYFKGHCNGRALGCYNVSILQTMSEPYALLLVYRDIILHFNSFSRQKNEFGRTGNGSGPTNMI